MSERPVRGTSGPPRSAADGEPITWQTLIDRAERYGFRPDWAAAIRPHPELLDLGHVPHLARALTAAAMARRGGPLTELIGVGFDDSTFIRWCWNGTVLV